jgi:CheY-like chemotaxis protein
MTPETQPPTHILLVEDDDIDIEAVQRAFRKGGITNPLHVVCDGRAALDALTGRHWAEKIPQPCIILLDINMPRMNGFEFLEEMRRDAALRGNVVFMLTTSERGADKARAYAQNVAGYILKENLDRLTAMLKEYCRLNQFPEIRQVENGY